MNTASRPGMFSELTREELLALTIKMDRAAAIGAGIGYDQAVTTEIYGVQADLYDARARAQAAGKEHQAGAGRGPSEASHEADARELVYDRAREAWVPAAEATDPDPQGGPYTIYDAYGGVVTEPEWEAEAGQ